MGATRKTAASKRVYFTRFNQLCDTNSRILVACADNVLSGQMHNVRIALRGKASIIMGKNTLMRRCITNRYESKPDDAAAKALYDAFIGEDLLRGNVGLVFTNQEVSSILDVLTQYKVQSNARAGAVAPLEVVIPAGPTGLEPTQTAFFIALNISTKIEKSQISILKDVTVCRVGEKVGSSEAKLLQKMAIRPFQYGLETLFFVEDGTVYPREFLSMSDDRMGAAVQGAVDQLAALALGTGTLIAPALSHLVFDAFKDILAIAVQSSTPIEDFAGAATLIENVKSGKAVAAAAPAPAAAAAGGAAKPAAAVVEEEEEEAPMDDLFG